MKDVRRPLVRIALCVALFPPLAVALAQVPGQSIEKQRQKQAPKAREFLGQVEAPAPPRSDEGDWNGTWIYASRDVRVALWARTTSGRPEFKLRYLHASTTEGFETDWSGHASYMHQGSPGTFDFTIDEGDPNTFSGTWNWVLTRDDSTRVETARVRGWRALDGRQLVLKFDDFVRRITEGEATPYEITPDFFWTFRKVSRRAALWDELPF